MIRFLDSYLNLGTKETDSAEVKRKKRIYVPMATSGVFIGILIGYFEASLGLFPQAYMPFLLSLFFILNLILFKIFKSTNLAQSISFLILTILPLLNQWSLGGFYAAGAISIWGISAPFGALIFQSFKEAIPQFILFLLAVIFTLVIEQFYPTPWKKIPENISFWLLLFNFPGFIIFIFANVTHFVRQKDNAMHALDREHSIAVIERKKSEKLLLNILPVQIADRLKKNEDFIADGFQNVSILFADIAGFTPLSNRLKPERLVAILNELFTHFDSLAEKYKLEKIKTIGDAYMAAAGLPEPDKNHAINCVNMALDMRDFMSATRIPEAENLSLRIGIHSGNVVAGVIGRKKFAYDLWGDAVNTASRMESHGIPGEIQITSDVKDLVKDHFLLTERGLVEVKGKGLLKTYFVKERKDLFSAS